MNGVNSAKVVELPERDPETGLDVIEKIKKLYGGLGYEVFFEDGFTYSIRRIAEPKGMQLGYGLHPTDVDQFLAIRDRFTVDSAFVIGNAFGLSTLCLAEVFRGATIDVIDAEVEGPDNREGSYLTRRLSKDHYPNVNLNIGHSPQDISKAVGNKQYDFVFIDGLHTNEQLIQDFLGIEPHCAESTVVYCHDVRYCSLYEGMKEIITEGRKKGFDYFCPVIRDTVLGSGVATRKAPEALESHFEKSAELIKEFREFLGKAH